MQVIFDTEEARRFVKTLSKERNELNAANRHISRKLVELRTGWRDKKYDQFETRFNEATEAIARFMEDAERYETYLKKRIRATERYLEGGY